MEPLLDGYTPLREPVGSPGLHPLRSSGAGDLEALPCSSPRRSEDHSAADEEALEAVLTSARRLRPVSSLPSDVGSLLAGRYEERLREEKQRTWDGRSLERVRGAFPLLWGCAALVGAAPGGRPPFGRSRVPWAAATAALQLLPAAAQAFMPRCAPSCAQREVLCGLCATGDRALLKLLIDAAFVAAVLLFAPRTLAALDDVYAASELKHPTRDFARRATPVAAVIFTLVGLVVPTARLARALSPSTAYTLSRGDRMLRVFHLLASPSRALLLTVALMGALLTMRLHTVELRAVRAAARRQGPVWGDEGQRPGAEASMAYNARLHAAFVTCSELLAHSASQMQQLLGAVTLYAANCLVGLVVSAVWPAASTSVQQQEENLMEDAAPVLTALVAFGYAARVTQLADGTLRVLQVMWALQVDTLLASCDRGETQLSEATVARMNLLTDNLVSTSGRSGFRVAGQRVTYSAFLGALTIGIAATNLAAANLKAP